jgi:hypothetical protein
VASLNSSWKGKEIQSLDATLSAHGTYLPSQWLPAVIYKPLLGENRRYQRHPGIKPNAVVRGYRVRGNRDAPNFSVSRNFPSYVPFRLRNREMGIGPSRLKPRMDDYH